MATELEERLRSALHGSAAAGGLPERVLVDSLVAGRMSLRRRRRAGVVTATGALALVTGVGVAAVQQDGDTAPSPAPPVPTSTSTPTEPETVASGAWANALPQGPAASVPYVAGTDVIEPDGTRVDTGGSGLGVIGLSQPGLVLLVETERDGIPFSSHYAVVTGDGELRDLPASTLTRDAAQEALVSPDGRYFTNGGEIIDLRDFSIVGEVPEAATIMLAWTPAGIVYSAGDYDNSVSTYHLLREDGSLVELDRNPGRYPNGTDIGMQGCRVVRLSSTGTTTPLSGCIRDIRSVSPSGRWALTDDLRLVDVASGESRYLAKASVDPTPYAFDKVWWDGDTSLLFPVGAHLVRCDTGTASCERATDGTELREGTLALP